MKKLTLISILITQLVLSPRPLHADILQDQERVKTDLIPETHTAQIAEQQAEDMNHVLLLSQSAVDSAATAQTFSIDLLPFGSQQSTAAVDEQAKTVAYTPSAGAGTLIGTFDAATLTASIGSSTSGIRYEFSFARRGQRLHLLSVSSRLSTGPSLSIRATYRFSDDGRTVGYALDFAASGLKQHVDLSAADAGGWKTLLSITDQNAQKLDYFEGYLDSASVHRFGDRSMDAQIRKIQESAATRTTLNWGTSVFGTHYERNAEGGWTRRFKTVVSGGLQTFIAGAGPNGADALFVQSQSVEGFPGYTASIKETGADISRQGYGLVFESSDQKIFVDFPRTDVVEIGDKKYRIRLNSDGRVVLTEAQNSSDFNRDGVTDDADIDQLAEAVQQNLFEDRLDLNRDGKVDREDVRIAGERYVEELKKSNTVLLVDPSQPDALIKARDSVRALTAGGMTQNVLILIPEGEYYQTALELDARDSGKDGFQIVYRGYPGQEMPRVIGGRALEPAAWQSAPEFSGNVYKMDLSVNGTAPDFSTVFVDGKAVSDAKSPDVAVTGVPTQNNLLTLFPEALQYAYWDGKKTILRTYLTPGKDDMRPLREEHFLGLNLTVAQINARRAADPAFLPDRIDSYAQFTFAEGALPEGMDIENATAEIWTAGFHMNLIKIRHIDWSTRTVTLESPAIWSMTKNLKNGVYEMEGIFEYNDVHQQVFLVHGSKTFLSEGQYHYSDGVLYYKAAAGETMANKKVVIPTTKQVLSVKGTEADPVHDIIFDRLDISVSHAVKDFKNNTIAQDHYFLPEEMSAFYLKNTRDVIVRNSMIHDTGAVGLLMDGMSIGNKITGNSFLRIGADGVVVNGDKIPARNFDLTYRPDLISHDNLITDNEIVRVGEVFRKSDGLRIVQSSDNVISGNRIRDIGGSGIFLIGMQEYMIAMRSGVPLTRDRDNPKYGVYYEFNLANNNQFLDNEISDINLYGGEGAAFYTHSAGKGNVISGNNIHDIYHGQNKPPTNVYWASSFGIYLDGGQSDYFTITNNHLHGFDTELGMPITINGSHNVITHNLVEQNNSVAPIQFMSGWDFAQRGNVLEHNTFKNSDPRAKQTMRLWQYLQYPYKEGMQIPSDAFVVNQKAKASDPDKKVLYVPAETFASNDYNTYDFASREYGVFTDWWDLTTFVPDDSLPDGGYLKTLLKVWVPHTEWRTLPFPGYTRVFEEHSTYIGN